MREWAVVKTDLEEDEEDASPGGRSNPDDSEDSENPESGGGPTCLERGDLGGELGGNSVCVARRFGVPT